MTGGPLTERLRACQGPVGLDAYRRAGGYEAALRARREFTPEGLQSLVTEAGLRGRGGAGFPTGVKWSFVPRDEEPSAPRYLVVNGDEMEPGTFKDRLLLENDPHLVLEGALIAAYAIGAREIVLFLRTEYRQAAAALRRAVAQAEAAGLLVGCLDRPVHVRLHVSAGRYICGEETALLNSLEGRRAVPRAKPPFPQVCGLFGRPTVVQNVETLGNLPGIVRFGAAWFRDLGLGPDGGTKLFGVSGRVRTPGLWELPMGTPLRQVLFDRAGGMRDGRTFRGVLPGGASTDLLTEESLDVPLDFDAVARAGSRLGTGTMIVLDDATCPVGFVHNLLRFFARESCGFCTPCREGLPWLERTLAALEEGDGRPEDLETLDRHVALLTPGSTFCPLAPGAMAPLGSALRHFRADFERHVAERRCPWR